MPAKLILVFETQFDFALLVGIDDIIAHGNINILEPPGKQLISLLTGIDFGIGTALDAFGILRDKLLLRIAFFK